MLQALDVARKTLEYVVEICCGVVQNMQYDRHEHRCAEINVQSTAWQRLTIDLQR